MLVSDCCGVPVVDDIAHIELCPRCWEHCECIEDDYIPGYDDGEACPS